MAISPSFVYTEMMHTLKNFKHEKVALILFILSIHFPHLQVHYFPFNKFFLSHILPVKIDEFSPWQCFALCLISRQERAKKYQI